MARQQRKRKTGKHKGKIKISQRARIIEKNDATRVAKSETYPIMQGRPNATVAPVFRVKIRKKQ